MKVAEVDRRDVSKLFLSMSDKPTQANRTLEIVSKMFNLAEEWGQRPPASNPRRGIKKFPETKRERFLSPAELARVGEVLDEMTAERIELASAISAVCLLILTGCRLNEFMTLQWGHVHLSAGILKLPDSKTGRKDVPLGQAAVEVLTGLQREKGNPWVLPWQKRRMSANGPPAVLAAGSRASWPQRRPHSRPPTYLCLCRCRSGNVASHDWTDAGP